MSKGDDKEALLAEQEADNNEETESPSEGEDDRFAAEGTPIESDVEVEALRRGVASSINSLADSIAEVMRKMRAAERRQNLNSFAAYALFTLLLGGGFALLYQSRVGSLVKAREDAVRERDAARARAVELQNEIGRRDAAAEAAYEYYALIRDKRRTEVLAGFPRVEQLALTPAEREFFTAGVARAKVEMVDAGYVAGLDAYRRGDYPRAIKELERALGYEVEGGQAALIRYYLGVSQHKVDDNDAAIRNLELALAGGVEQAGVADARFHLGGAFETVGSLEEARKEYSKFAAASPRSPLAPVARNKVALLARQIALATTRDSAGALRPGVVPGPTGLAPSPSTAPAAGEAAPAPVSPKPSPKPAPAADDSAQGSTPTPAGKSEPSAAPPSTPE